MKVKYLVIKKYLLILYIQMLHQVLDFVDECSFKAIFGTDIPSQVAVDFPMMPAFDSVTFQAHSYIQYLMPNLSDVFELKVNF